jgi:hypothetical protein
MPEARAPVTGKAEEEKLVVMSKKDKPGVEKTLAQHILPTSGTMIGICTTLIGLVKVIEGRIGPSHVDEYAACASLLFLISAVTSYLSIRYDHRQRFSQTLETIADQCFLVGLICITCIGLLFAYEAI